MPGILFLTAYPIEDASSRYRVHQFIDYLERAGYKCTISSFATLQLFCALRVKGRLGHKFLHTSYCSLRRLARLANLSQFEYIVIHREAFPFFTPALEKWILRRHRKVVFSFDDAIYAGHDDVSALNHPQLYRWKYGSGYDEIIRRSLHTIAGNPILAEYARKFSPNVSVIPTVVDTRRYWFKPPQENGDRRITIGWMGSRSTSPYLSLIEPALDRLAQAHPGRVQFRFFGHPEYKLDLPEFSSLPFNLDRENDDLHSLDVGLMPLPDTGWTRGKCAFKAIQYMATGIPTVASPVGVTSDLIRHDVNGLLAASSDEWYQSLNRLITDASLRKRIALNARRTIEEEYSLQVWGPRFVSLFDQHRASKDIFEKETVAA